MYYNFWRYYPIERYGIGMNIITSNIIFEEINKYLILLRVTLKIVRRKDFDF